MKKKAPKSATLPRIRIDDDTGEKYVLVGKKKVWLPVGVDKKSLRSFLSKRRKRKAAKTKKRCKKTRSKTDRKKKVVPREIEQPSSRLLLSETALKLAAQAVNNSSKSIDDNKLAERIEKKLLAIMPPKEDTSQAVVPHNGRRKSESRSSTELGAISAAYGMNRLLTRN